MKPTTEGQLDNGIFIQISYSNMLGNHGSCFDKIDDISCIDNSNDLDKIAPCTMDKRKQAFLSPHHDLETTSSRWGIG